MPARMPLPRHSQGSPRSLRSGAHCFREAGAPAREHRPDEETPALEKRAARAEPLTIPQFAEGKASLGERSLQAAPRRPEPLGDEGEVAPAEDETVAYGSADDG